MKTNFILPSCCYNLVLSKEDIEQLLTKGYITINPYKTEGICQDEHGIKHEKQDHVLMYNDDSIQFISIVLDK
jgi:hypothetical protein